MKDYEIKKEDSLEQVFGDFPYIMQVYVERGMHCVGCDINTFETVGESFKHHKLENEDEFLKYLNEVKNNSLTDNENE